MIQIFGEDYISRKPKDFPGFPKGFQNIFETYIECFTPYKNILGIIRIEFNMQPADLDKFCQLCYGMNSLTAYNYLVNMADVIMRQCMVGLSKSGNKTAMSFIGGFANWDKAQQTANLKVSISGGINPTGKYSDEEEQK